MHHTPHVDPALSSVEHIMRDVKGGWWLRHMHANGASPFFIVVHSYILCGSHHGSYASLRESVRCIGAVILSSMIITVLMGYVPSWG